MTFIDDFREKRAANNGAGPGSWGHVLNGLAALAMLWVIDLYLLVAAGWWPMTLGLVLIPLGGVVLVRGWVYSALLMGLGLLLALTGVIGSFVLNNAVS